MSKSLYQFLPQLHVFRTVVAAGSFQAAANQLHLPRSSVSKKMVQLENKFGHKLIHRSTRYLQLTEAGEALLAKSNGLDEAMSQFEQLIDSHHLAPSGQVKISSSTLLGQRFLLPRLKHLKTQYPDIDVTLSMDDNVVDLIRQQVDIAIRVGELPDSSLVARRVGEKSWGWFASPDYLTTYGEPDSPHHLSEHQCLVFKNNRVTLNHWQFHQASKDSFSIQVPESFVSNDGRTLVDMACAGLGIIMIDPLLIRNEIKTNALQPIFSDWSHPQIMPIHLVSFGKPIRSRATDCVWQDLVPYLKQKLSFGSPIRIA